MRETEVHHAAPAPRGTWLALAAAIASLGLLAGCSTGAPDPSSGTAEAPPDGGGTVVTAQDSGIVVSLALSSASVAAGGTIDIAVAATNAGIDDATYESGGCGPTSDIGITGPPITEPTFNENAPPADTNGAPILSLARWSALMNATPALDMIRKPGWGDDIAFGCPANLAFDQLAPGGHLEDTWRWTAQNGFRVPAAPGAYTVRYTFPYVGRGKVRFDDGGLPVARHSVIVEAPLTVTQPATPLPVLTADEAIMAAIADPDVKAWANRALTRETLQGSTIRYADGAWRWTITYPTGAATIDVDPVTGAVIAKRL